MTKQLESFFDLPPSEKEKITKQVAEKIAEADNIIDKIETALPTVRGLDEADTELDDLATMAQEAFKDLSSLGMQVDSRYAGELFSVAGTMLGHAITAKTAKINKKLKMIDLQMKKMALEQKKKIDEPTDQESEKTSTLTFDRNALLEKIMTNGKSSNK